MSNAKEKFGGLVKGIVESVSEWAGPAGWVATQYPKRMRTPDRAVFEVPALFLQRGPTRLLLDPVAYDVPGSDAVVDLYLMPTYDDLASLSYTDGRWAIHYASPTGADAVPMATVGPEPFDQAHLIKTLDAIASHATPSV